MEDDQGSLCEIVLSASNQLLSVKRGKMLDSPERSDSICPWSQYFGRRKNSPKVGA